MNDVRQEPQVDPWGLFTSPGTDLALEHAGRSLRAPGTNEEYPIREGVPHFLRYGPVESAKEEAELEELNRRARERGWDTALAETYAGNPGMFRYVTDEARAVFLDFVPIRTTDTVLDVGPGLGQFTTLLAAKAREVYVLEVVSGQAIFVATRARQVGLANVTVACGGDDCRLPYRAEAFDVIIMNLVFEWCASRNREEEPEVGQRRLLSEIVRVLKPGGCVFLSTKNRFGLQYLLGGRDEHVFALRYGSTFPRWLTRVRLSLSRQGRPPGLLHSYRELRHMLSECGLSHMRSYWVVPDMRYPIRIVPSDTRSIKEARREALVQGDSKRLRWVMRLIPASLVRYITPGLTFTARKAVKGSGAWRPRDDSNVRPTA